MSTRYECAVPMSLRQYLHFPVLAIILLLTACAGHDSPAMAVEPQPAPPVAEQPAELPSTQVYFYPKAGQSAEQQDRDRYDCYLWAKKQTRFDPSDPRLAPHQQVQVEPVPPSGHDTLQGAATGAVIGAAVSRHGERAGGAIVGAVAGAAIGAASDASRQEQARRIQQRYDSEQAAEMATNERQAADYRRAMAACLEGRGYSVSE